MWAGEHVTFDGEIYAAGDATLGTLPVQRPAPPIWLGSFHPDALRRAARLGDGWMGAGGSSAAAFADAVPFCVPRSTPRAATRPASPSPSGSSCRCTTVPTSPAPRSIGGSPTAYGNSALTDQAGVFGTPDEVGAQLETLVAAGATHLLLNPVTRYEEQVEALAVLTGLV